MHDYPFGLDAVWLASDGQGHVATLTTAGEGPVPQTAVGLIQDSEFEKSCNDLPRVTECTTLLAEGRADTWVSLAERGFFAYDWQDVYRTRDRVRAYDLIARPHAPLSLSCLPQKLREAAERSKLPDVSFASASALDVEVYVPCLTRDGRSIPQRAQSARDEKQRLLARLAEHRNHGWAAAAIAALARPEMQLTDQRNVQYFARAEYLLIVQRLRKRHAEKDGMIFEGLDELIEVLGRLNPETLLTGARFAHGDSNVRAFYGPSGELVGCLSGPAKPPLQRRVWRMLVGPHSRT